MAGPHNPHLSERKLLAIIRGINAVLVNGKTIPYKGTPSDASVLLPILTQALAPYVNVHDLRSALRVAMQEKRAADPASRQLVHDTKVAVECQFGNGTEFEQFGFKPRKKPAPLTPEKKQLKVDRLRATRSARHVMGKRQKAAIKGQPKTPTSPPPEAEKPQGP